MTSTIYADAAIVAAATAIVFAPIDPAVFRDMVADLTAPDPELTPQPAPVYDETLISAVRAALGLSSSWRPVPECGESETRVIVWSQIELNTVFERVGGTVTSRQVERASSDGFVSVETEITVTVDLPGIGSVEVCTDWFEDYAAIGGGRDLPVMRALAAPQPRVLEAVPARPGRGIGFERLAVAPGAPLPDGRTVVAVEDPLGSAWRVTDDLGGVRYLHKSGDLVRYTTGVVAFLEPEWAGWASD